MGDHWYRGLGLCVRSEIALPELLPSAPVANPDIRLRFTPEATKQWETSGAVETEWPSFVPAPSGGFVMRVAGICDYWVREGREIGLSPAEIADRASVRLFLIGSAMGMAFHQRGMLVLHGATVLREGGATIFVGESGQGKSTLAASLGRAGHAILGDDTMPLWPVENGFKVWPGSRMFKLWSSTIEALGATSDGLQRVGRRFDKFFVPNEVQAQDEAVPICEVVLLEAAEPGSAPVLEPLAGLAALQVISEHTYRLEYVSLLGRGAEHFRLCSRLAGRIAVARLRRPWDLDRIDSTLAMLRAHWPIAEPISGGSH